MRNAVFDSIIGMLNCLRKMPLMVVTFSCLMIIPFVIGAPIDVSEASATVDNTNLTSNCPRIVTREEWGARECSSPQQPMEVLPATYVVAHHGGIPHYCYDQQTCSTIVRSYQDLHMDVQKWIDIGYHFVIGGDGNVYEGRGWNYVGAHSPGYNTQGIGISIIGDYTSHMPNEASLAAFHSLVECGISLGKVTPDYKLIGHRQARVTECPGQKFYDYLKTLPHWEANPVPRFAASAGSANTTRSVKPQTIDITGTELWTELIALGEPETVQRTTEQTVEENVVDTENSNASK